MSGAIAVPEVMTLAATDLATIGSNLSAAHAVAAAPALAVQSAAADEISTGVAQLFSQHARDYQALARQATAFHEQFVQHLTAGACCMPAPRPQTPRCCSPSTPRARLPALSAGCRARRANLLNTVQSQLLNLISTVRAPPMVWSATTAGTTAGAPSATPPGRSSKASAANHRCPGRGPGPRKGTECHMYLPCRR
jgi:hypothetical protein